MIASYYTYITDKEVHIYRDKHFISRVKALKIIDLTQFPYNACGNCVIYSLPQNRLMLYVYL